MRRFLALTALLVFSIAADAAPLERDLGQGLVYYRVHRLPADLPTAEVTRRQPCVLDLRYVRGDAETAAALAAWLKFHATPHAPVFLLANAGTEAALIAPLAVPRPGASIVVIGGASPGFTPDIALKISVDSERRAYDALEHGVSVDSLLTENADKPRNDEAKLAKERQDSPPPEELPGITVPLPDADGPPKPKPPPLIDVALQRAVQLHRTLVALKKI